MKAIILFSSHIGDNVVKVRREEPRIIALRLVTTLLQGSEISG